MVGNEEERRQRAGLFVLFVTLNLNQKSHLDKNNINSFLKSVKIWQRIETIEG